MDRVEKVELDSGDHICFIERDEHYSHHHGIYIGAGKVVHFTQDPKLLSLFAKSRTNCTTCEALGSNKHENGVMVSCLNCFLGDGSSLYRSHYTVGNMGFVLKEGDRFTLNSGNCDRAEIAIERAMNLLENGAFHKFNNSRDFASYCKTGFVSKEYTVIEAMSMLWKRDGILSAIFSRFYL